MGYVEELRALVGSRPLVLTAAGVVALDDRDRLLLGRRADSGLWSTPGGYLEPGETLEETARRELREEAGLTARDLELLSVASGPDMFVTYANGDQVYVVGAIFVTRSVEGELQPDEDEFSELGWFPLDALPDIHPIDRPSIEAVRRHLAGAGQ